MEKMVSARLIWYLETCSLLSPAQSIFRRYWSTDQQIVKLNQEIEVSLDRKEPMLAGFVDFRSTYDAIWRVKLADKLQKIGVKCRMPKWFHSLITQCF
jgi:hypothetical protein